MKKLDTPAAKAIIGAAVIDDVLGLLFLSFSQELVTRSFSPGSILLLALKAFGFLALGTTFGKFILSKLVTKMDRTALAKQYPEFVFVFAMVVCFFYSTMSEIVGLSAIVGAFVAGVSLEGVGLKHSKSYKEASDHLRIIFGAIFFVSLGILVDIKIIDIRLAGFMMLLVLLAIATKIVGCSGISKLLGLSTRDSLIVDVGMVPRGEVAMIVALIGLEQGFIGEDIYATVILMSLLTTMFAPLALSTIFKQGVKKVGPVP